LTGQRTAAYDVRGEVIEYQLEPVRALGSAPPVPRRPSGGCNFVPLAQDDFEVPFGACPAFLESDEVIDVLSPFAAEGADSTLVRGETEFDRRGTGRPGVGGLECTQIGLVIGRMLQLMLDHGSG